MSIQFSNIITDNIAGGNKFFPPINLCTINSPPPEYNNLSRIKLKLTDDSKMAIEANKKFRLLKNNKNYSYYDTVALTLPDSIDYLNRLYLSFEGSKNIDSIHILITKTNNSYYRQIFYSSIAISGINNFGEHPEEFRVKTDKLVNETLLENNDTLINDVFYRFNLENPKSQDCGTLCNIFKNISESYKLPGRLVGLHGGKLYEPGYEDRVGYPIHAVCEIYSSKYRKWYVVDPLFGFRFKNPVSNEYLSAVEINDLFMSKTENLIVQDSVLLTKSNLIGSDYFQYYENVYYHTNYNSNKFVRKILNILFDRYNFDYYHYSRSTVSSDSYSYLTIKLAIYFILSIIYITFVIFFILKKAMKKNSNELSPGKLEQK